MRLKNILLPTDLSQRSKRSLRYALSLATEYSASITVLHVANESDSGSFTPMSLASGLRSNELGRLTG
jgi:nucleotide-binding universal stress UspA family protein